MSVYIRNYDFILMALLVQMQCSRFIIFTVLFSETGKKGVRSEDHV